MANEILRFRYGVKADLPASKQAGQLLFATYQDAKSQRTESKVYFDVSDNQRIILSNDVDRAKSLLSGVTGSTGLDGAWTVELDGVSSLYDGLTIAIKLNARSNSIYNTLRVNDLAPKLVWESYGTRVTTQYGIHDELILVYRDNCGSYTTPSSKSGTPETLEVNTTYGNTNANSISGGWIVLNSGKGTQVASTTIDINDRLMIADASDSYKLKMGITFDGTTETQALTQAGTWKPISKVTLKEWGSVA